MRRRRVVRIHPSKPSMVLSLVVGVIFCLLGVFIVIPTFGVFGLFWTLISAGITVVNAMPLFSGEDRDLYHTMTIEEDGGYDGLAADTESDDIAARLEKLKALYDRRLITAEEYESKREEILRRL